MQKLNSFKDRLKKIYDDLNNIDIKILIEKLKNINVEDIKNINSKNIFILIKTSPYTKYTLSFIFFILFTIMILTPSIKVFNEKYKLSNQYKKERRDLERVNNDLFNIKKKYNKISSKMNKIQTSIIQKEKLIFLTNLFDELSKSTSVRIDLLSPLDKENPSICSISEITNIDSKSNRRKIKSQRKSRYFGEANYELRLNGDYLNIIKFLNYIQNYDVMIIANCLQVDKDNSENKKTDGFVKANLLIRLPIRNN